MIPRFRRHRVRPEEVALVRARLQRLRPGAAPAPVVTGGWTPEQPVTPVAPAEPVVNPGWWGAWTTRFDLSRSAVLGLVAVAALAVAVSFAIGWHSRARPVQVSAPPGGPSSGPVVSTGVSPTPAPRVVVDVAGRVRRPGLVTLPAGSRVADALRAAGGVRRGVDLTALNLAALLVDGEQILVGGPGGPVGPVAAAPGSGAAAPAQPIDLNSADVAALDELPGIGPVLAQRIVDYRASHGRFHDVSQLQDVSGIGTAKYAELRALVRV